MMFKTTSLALLAYLKLVKPSMISVPSFLLVLLVLLQFCNVFSFTLGFHPPLIIKGTKLKMTFEWDLCRKTAEDKLKRTVDSISTKFGNIRASGANPSMLEKVLVSLPGKSNSLLGSISKIFVSGANTLIVEPSDKSVLGNIEKSIQRLEMDYVTVTDGTVVRVGIPPLTEERRHELVKHAKLVLEEGKVSMRNTRRESLDLVRNAEKGKVIGKDMSKGYQDDLQKLTDKYVKNLDTMFQAKEKDLLKL